MLLLLIREELKVGGAYPDPQEGGRDVAVSCGGGPLDRAGVEVLNEGVDLIGLSSGDAFRKEGNGGNPRAGLGIDPSVIRDVGDESGEEALEVDAGLCSVVGVLEGAVAKGLKIRVASLIGDVKPSDW